MTVLLRDRAPLTLRLWTASRDGRLVWQDEHGFALLESPKAERAWRNGRPVERMPSRMFLRSIDGHWDLAVFFGGVALVFSGALLTAAIGGYSGLPLLTALLMVVLAMSFAMLLSLTQAVQAVVSILRTFTGAESGQDMVAGQASFEYWLLTLVHQDDDRRVAALISEARLRFHLLLEEEVDAVSRRLGKKVRQLETEESLGCLLNGATTPAVRRALIQAAAHTGATKIVFLDGGTRREGEEPLSHRVVDAGGFLLLYLFGMVLWVCAMAPVVAGFEAAACAAANACHGSPTTSWEAARWLFGRLMFVNPEGFRVISPQALVTAYMGVGMTLMLPFVGYAAIKKNIAWRADRLREERERLSRMTRKSRALVMVATDVEARAVLQEVGAATGQEAPEEIRLRDHTVFRLGVLSATEVLLVRTAPGSSGPLGAALTAQAAIEGTEPDFLLLIGIGYGLKEDEQRLGDIMVSTQIRLLDHRKVVDGDRSETPREFYRGARPDVSVVLHDRVQAASLIGWDGPSVWFGPMVAMDVLLNSETLRARIRHDMPDCIGGEMEAGGVYSAAARESVDWIVVKAICDWGHDKTDGHQREAAANAARFVTHLLKAGRLDYRPGPRRSGGSGR